jgi:twinkle protein
MQKGTYVEKIIHDKDKGGCGAHALGIFQQKDGTYNGFCFSCSSFIRHPYAAMPDGYEPPKPRSKTKEEIEQELADIATYPVKDLPDRKLNARTLQHFNVRVGLSEENGTDVAMHFYPYTKGNAIRGYNVRVVDGKKFFKLGETTGLEPFGWQQALLSKHSKLFITEGEIDAMSLFKIIMMHSTFDSPAAVISLPSGVTSVPMMSPYIGKMKEKFKEVILVFDNDEPGQTAIDNFLKLMPEAKVASLPLKDANEMLKAGMDKECFNTVMFNSRTRLSGKMVSSDSLWEKAKVRPEMGVSWPWAGLTDLTRGIRTKEGYYFGAGTKMGKSCVVNALATHFVVEHGERVFLCKPEEDPVVTARKLAGYAVGRVFDDPKIEFDMDAFDEGASIIADNVILFNSYQKTDWTDVKHAIRQSVVGQGCKRVIIDPITCFTVGISAGERNEVLVEIASEIAAMAMELDFTYFIFCHLNKPDAGKPHERGGGVQSVQFAGSRAMMRSCHGMIGIEGNKDPDLPEEQRNMRDLVLLEDRNFGESGRVHLFYNRQSGQLSQIDKRDYDMQED